MSESIENKIKQTFEDSINVKQKVIDEGAYKVLLDAGNVIAESISKKGKLLICGNGGEALQYCDSAFLVPDKVTARIQESHITAGHALLQYVEDKLLQNGWLTLDK